MKKNILVLSLYVSSVIYAGKDNPCTKSNDSNSKKQDRHKFPDDSERVYFQRNFPTLSDTELDRVIAASHRINHTILRAQSQQDHVKPYRVLQFVKRIWQLLCNC